MSYYVMFLLLSIASILLAYKCLIDYKIYNITFDYLDPLGIIFMAMTILFGLSYPTWYAIKGLIKY